jgi:radical SAM protein with 4Fe4S-binding SPASM domain
MISYAKSSKKVDYIDTTTNASLMTKERLKPVLDAGIDKINISIDGMNNETYESFTKTTLEFSEIIENVKWLYRNKGNTEVVVKIPADIINEKEKKEFFEVFGDYSDRIFVENFAPCWPEFDVEKHTGVKITKGIYQQEITETNTCPYIFYSFSVNADGLVSSCFLDWKRKLIIGDVRVESMKEIWNSKKMNDLRIMHLEGKRKKIDSCGSCGQLSHCLPDNIDKFVNEIKDNLLKSLPAL